jgi:hypothetical protein
MSNWTILIQSMASIMILLCLFVASMIDMTIDVHFLLILVLSRVAIVVVTKCLLPFISVMKFEDSLSLKILGG